MAGWTVTLDGKAYKLAANSTNATSPDGPRAWVLSQRPSQQGDPSISQVAEWRVDGPTFNSFEDVAEGSPTGLLSTDYTDNCDTRWDGELRLGPLLSTVTLSAYDTASYSVIMRPTFAFSCEWPSSTGGDNASTVDETVSDADATYNSTNVAGAIDLFFHTSSGLPPGTKITKITVTVVARKEATGTATSIKTYVQHGLGLGALASTPQTFTDNTSYQTFSVDYATNPETSLAWTVEEVDACWFGYQFNAGSTVRVTQAYATVVADVPNANGSAVVTGPNGQRFLYVIRGKNVAKLCVAQMCLTDPGTVITLAENATSILATETTSGTKELSIGMASTAYEVISAIASPGSADTHAANTASKVCRILAQASDRVVGLTGATAKGLILSGTTMGAPSTNWNDVATISGIQGIESTGFAQDGQVWIWGTNKGPFELNADTLNFAPLIDETGLNMENCRAMGRWSFLHALIPTVTAFRYQKDGDGASIGPEMFPRNMSPVQGVVTGFASTTRGMFVALYNPATRNTYLLYGRPARDGEYHSNPVSWFTIAKVPALRVDFLRNLDRDGGRVNPTLVGGYGSNLFSMTMGRSERWPDDEFYAYASPGTWYGTEMRRSASMLKDLEAVEFFSVADIQGTITVGFTVDGGSLHQLTGTLKTDAGVAINGPAVTSGPQRLLFVDDTGAPLSWASGTFIKPQLTMVESDTFTSSVVKGTLRLYYRARPRMTQMLDTTFVLDSSTPTADADEQATALLALEGSGPVAMTDHKNVTSYWRIDAIHIGTQKAASGGTQDVGRQDISIATIHATRWPTGEGE